MKINVIEVDNFKRLRAVRMELSDTGLNVIGGRNGQGKTSALDAIAWGLGGGKLAPTNPRNGESDPYIKIELSNGLIVERKGKNSSLHVSDEKGMRGGQHLLDSFVCELALDLPRFINASAKEKTAILLDTLGIANQLAEFDQAIKNAYEGRAVANRVAKDAANRYEAMEHFPEVTEAIDVSKLSEEFDTAETENRQRVRIANHIQFLDSNVRKLSELKEDLLKQLANTEEKLKATIEELDEYKDREVEPIDTSEIVSRITDADRHNRLFEKNQERAKQRSVVEFAEKDASERDEELKRARLGKVALLEGSDLPLEGLTIEEGELLYKGQPWDGMSGSEQLIVSASIARAIKPECQFVLMDKLEQMDADTLKSFGDWVTEQGLQIIATRVSLGDECSFIIEDGALLEVAEEMESEVVS